MDTRTEVPTTGEITPGSDLTGCSDRLPNLQCETDRSIVDRGVETNNAVLEGIWIR